MSPPRPPVHPAVTEAQSKYHADLVEEVAAAVAKHEVVVVGVSGLQPGKRARRLLDEQQVPYRSLEYGSSLSGWRRRLALPHVFVKGTFIGGASDLGRLIASGELKSMLGR